MTVAPSSIVEPPLEGGQGRLDPGFTSARERDGRKLEKITCAWAVLRLLIC